MIQHVPFQFVPVCILKGHYLRGLFAVCGTEGAVGGYVAGAHLRLFSGEVSNFYFRP